MTEKTKRPNTEVRVVLKFMINQQIVKHLCLLGKVITISKNLSC